MGEIGWQNDGRAPVAARLLDAVRSAFRPSNLLPGALLVLGWLAFIGWTGAGSDGWQARICADLAEQARSCSMVQGAGGGAMPANERSSS